MQKNKATLIGVALILLGYFLFSLNDAISKILLQDFGLGQLLLFRSLGAFVILSVLLKIEKPSLKEVINIKPLKLHILRLLCTTADVVCFYIAVIYLPLTDVMTFYMAGPIYVAVVSHFLLKDHLSKIQWTAIIIGFIGVVVALQPSSSSISVPAILALLGGLGFSLLIICNRLLRDTRDSIMVTWQNIATLVIGIVLCYIHWYPIDSGSILIFVLFGSTACLAHLFISKALKFVNAAVVAPTQYTVLLWAIFFDYWIFNRTAEPHMYIGALIIILSGMCLMYRKTTPAPNTCQ